MTMSPLLPLEDSEYTFNLRHEFYEHFLSGAWNKWVTPAIPPSQLRKVLADDEHPMRLAMWVLFASACTDSMWGMRREYYCKTVETKEDLQRVRSRYNTFINKQLGFMKK